MGIERNMGDMPDEAALQEAFRFFDKDEDQQLTHEEFTKMVQSLGQTPTQARLNELLQENAAGGTVDMEACKKMMPDIAKEKKTRQQVIDAFKVFDNRSDGHITVENFRNMMGQVGEKLKPQEVDEAVAKALEVAKGSSAGESGDCIEYEKYVTWMMGN